MIRVKKLEVEMVGEGNRLDDLQTIGPTEFGRIKGKTAVVECPGEFEVVETEDGKLIGRLVCR